jgi:hypothetical protein
MLFSFARLLLLVGLHDWCLSDRILLYGLLSGRHVTLQPRGAHTEPHGVVRGSVGFQWLCVLI